MQWEKLGLIFCPTGEVDWMHSHASVPIAEHLEGQFFRIYFSTRDRHNRSSTGYVIIDIDCPDKVIEVSSTPILSPGQLGGFDDSGAMGTWLTKHNHNRYLYYVGWNLGVTVPFRNSIGLATSSDGRNFDKAFRGPIVDRTMTEPHFCSTCCVIPQKDRWRMWYQSCTGWSSTGNHPKHRYHIKYAESCDGIFWSRDGLIAIDYKDESEYAICRPSVLRDRDCWRMWFSARGDSYRIYYAESQDGRVWERLDHLSGIDVSESGWDSEMIEYPFVFDCRGERYMLYNGNGYGKTGFGMARLVAS